jgi:flagellar biogenesis protein FliO
MPPVATAATSLGIVLGLFMLVMWVARRGAAGDVARLPAEAVEVLGRAPFVGRQHVHLVRCGNKLLLVWVTPTTLATLTEITDPVEVERLLDLCQPEAGGGSPLRHVLERFGNSSRDRHYAGRHEASEIDFSQLEAMHASAEESVV